MLSSIRNWTWPSPSSKPNNDAPDAPKPSSRSYFSFANPKATLANYLFLETFFEVDPTLIQTSLLSSEGSIVLPSTIYKRQYLGKLSSSHYNEWVVLDGNVDEVEFAWQWGGASDGSTSFVRDARLAIRGAKFRIHVVRLVKDCKEDREAVVKTDNVTTTSPDSPSAPPQDQKEGYLQRHVQEIIDSLMLNFVDMELRVELDNPHAGDTTTTTAVILSVQSGQLVSLGRSSDIVGGTNERAPLSQRISMANFAATIESFGAARDHPATFPLLDGCSYAAIVRRVTGRRFVDGIGKGLEVEGEIQASALDVEDSLDAKAVPKAPCLTIHFGTDQVLVLGRLFQAIRMFHNESLITDVKPDPELNDSAPESQSAPTTFLMPFPGVKILLPNQSSIDLPSCTARYNTDGSCIRVEGKRGILLNERHPLIRLGSVSTEEGESVPSFWSFDFCARSFTVEAVKVSGEDTEGDTFYDAATGEDRYDTVNGGHSSANIATVVWQEDQMKLLLEGVKMALSARPKGLLGESESLKSTSTADNPFPWSIRFDGQLGFLAKSHRTNDASEEIVWLSATIDSPKAKIDTQTRTLVDFQASRIALGPLSVGNLELVFPKLRFGSASSVYCPNCY